MAHERMRIFEDTISHNFIKIAFGRRDDSFVATYIVLEIR